MRYSFPALILALLITCGVGGCHKAKAAAQASSPCVQSATGQCVPVGPSNPLPSGSDTGEACTAPTVTVGTYGAGNEVGALLAISLFNSQPAVTNPPYSGYLTSLRLNFKDTQSAEFDVSLFQTQPVNTTWTDKTTPALAQADAFSNYPPIRLTLPYAGLGTGTVYGADAIGHAMKISGSTLYAVIVAPSGATIGSTSDVQLCVTVQKDNG